MESDSARTPFLSSAPEGNSNWTSVQVSPGSELHSVSSFAPTLREDRCPGSVLWRRTIPVRSVVLEWRWFDVADAPRCDYAVGFVHVVRAVAASVDGWGRSCCYLVREERNDWRWETRSVWYVWRRPCSLKWEEDQRWRKSDWVLHDVIV